jgi:hypothetical protein
MNWTGRLGATWGAVGVTGILLFAIGRIAPRAIRAYETDLDLTQWIVTILFAAFMAYSEGYRGFQRRFSPRTAARVRYLRDRPNLLRSVFAPLFAMGYFHANRRTRIIAFSLSMGVLALVLLVRLLAQPWRGIVAAGVVLGLTWGTVSLVASIATALTRDDYPTSPEVE